MRKVAVTGLLSAGKSTVCKIFKKLGAYVVDSDALVHALIKIDHPIGKQLIKLLGPTIITDHQIDRKKIADIVFSNPEKLKAVEAMIHPAVRKEIARLSKDRHEPLFVAEVPRLEGMEADFDAIIEVTASEQVRKQRTSFADFERRSNPQKITATFVIHNDGDTLALEKQVKTIMTTLGET